MADRLADRVQEVTSSLGAGALLLDGGPTLKNRGFAGAGYQDGETFPGVIEHATAAEVEVVKCTYHAGSPGYITRGTPIWSTTGGTVDFSAGVKTITVAVTASQIAAAAGVDFQGEWLDVTTYSASQGVSFAGTSYVSIVDDNTNHQPNVSPDQWQIIAEKGDQGLTGPAGADGALASSRYYSTLFADGYTLPAADKAALSAFFLTLQDAGIYDLIDDMWMFAQRDDRARLRSLKRRVLGTAVNSPATSIRGMQFIAASSQYFRTGFIPSSHAAQMTGSKGEFGVYSNIEATGVTTPFGVYQGTNQRLEITPRDGGNHYFTGFNAATSSYGAITSAVGLVSAYRDGSTHGSRKNGAAAATYVPGSNGTALPTYEMYIGARNNAGTADQKYDGTIAFAFVGGLLSTAQEAILYAALQTYLIAVGALDVYISTTSGSSTAIGDLAHPLDTWDRGYAATQPLPGVSMWCDGTTNTPQTYKSTSNTITYLDKGITVRAINPFGAKITSNGATNGAVGAGPAAGETINIYDVIMDPSLNGSAVAAYALRLDSKSVAFTLNCTRCKFTGYTGSSGYGVNTASASFKGSGAYTDCVWVADDCNSAMTINTLIEGAFSIINPTITITNHRLGGWGAIYVKAQAAGCTFNVTGAININLTVKAALTGTTQHYGIYMQHVVGKVSGTSKDAPGTINIWGPGSPRGAKLVVIETNGAGDATELPITGSICENMTGYIEPGGGGWGFGVGNDGNGDNSKMVGCILRNLTVRASTAAGAAGNHGVFGGHLRDADISYFDVDSGGLNLVCKNLDGTWRAHHGTVKGFTQGGLLAKGCGGTGKFDTCKVVATPANPGGACPGIYVIQDALGSGTYTSGLTVSDIEVDNNGASNFEFFNIETGSAATAIRNLYMQNAGSKHSTDAFRDGATAYATFALWKAAKGTTDAANFA